MTNVLSYIFQVREHDDCGSKDKCHRQGGRYSTVEPKTESIDRVVAILLFNEAATSKGGSSNQLFWSAFYCDVT